MTSGIYLITCTQNNKRYVGSARDITYRWRKHREQLRAQTHCNRFLQRSWNKYGEPAFEIATLELVEDQSQLKIREQKWIDLLHPEFNLSPFAQRPDRTGRKASEKTKQRMSKAQRQMWANLSEDERRKRMERLNGTGEKGKSRAALAALAEQRRIENAAKKAARQAEREAWEAGREQRELERREKLRSAFKGRPVDKATRKKISESTIKRQQDPEYRERQRQGTRKAMQNPETLKRLSDAHKGIKQSEEHKAKKAAAHRGRKRPPETGQRIAEAQRARWARIKAEKEQDGTARG